MFRSLLFGLFVASLAQCSVIKRDAPGIVASLNAISSQLATMNSTLNTFPGGAGNTLVALQVQGEAQTLLDTINNGTKVANQTGPLDVNDSALVVDAVLTLQPNIYGVLNHIIAAKPDFDTAVLGLASAAILVKSDLTNLKNSTDQLFSATVSKLVTDIQNLAPLVQALVDLYFVEAINTYS
ncbi:hydrophobic surface binding protein A-domain-containing protein [Talaromyces proteolyticus]|uniref:Hydrophobic surface binding protein A-domain-containing protein n=1 Tax=Talaromyces proteolyticus TaxID=1131652 RepID=A0AAD4L695_9EURO|nr:hydrophobic surface binding protein A-domain-containing protein [Talaromyces proteolyticus]KAH8705365.1 hydrophobic surface binding protein A-domain-containing protein [Talaromyces proteolyticus]